MNRREFLKNTSILTMGTVVADSEADGGNCADTLAKVQTVLGQVSPDRLGVTLMHEHTPLVDWSELYETPAADVNLLRNRMLSETSERLKVFHNAIDRQDGPGAVVECTPIRVGRYPDLLVDLAHQSPVHIIACTGFWCEAVAPQHPWALRFLAKKNGVQRMAELYIREIREGMEDPSGSWGEQFTEIKAGIIKAATSTYLRPNERRIHEAAAIASVETGCPITTHTTDGGGLDQAHLFLSHGVKPEKVIIGHQGSLDDRENEEAHEIHLRIAQSGCYVQFDRVGSERYPIDKMVRQIKRLTDAGHTRRVLLGHDHVPFFYGGYSQKRKPTDAWQTNEADFTIVPNQLATALVKAGVTRDGVRTILVENPRRALAF